MADVTCCARTGYVSISGERVHGHRRVRRERFGDQSFKLDGCEHIRGLPIGLNVIHQRLRFETNQMAQPGDALTVGAIGKTGRCLQYYRVSRNHVVRPLPYGLYQHHRHWTPRNLYSEMSDTETEKAEKRRADLYVVQMLACELFVEVP